MNKYIDAEKLKAKIERRKNEWQALISKNNAVNPTAVKEVICEDLNILDIITSLQQEQPEVDLVAELKQHLATTPKEQLEKEWKELEPWDNIGPTVREFLYGKQPEEDLKKK